MTRVERVVRRSIASSPRVVLAISGGRDSMVLLDAAARVARERIAAIATFDHVTGPWSARATALVERRARELTLPFVAGRAGTTPRRATEAKWRAERWRFLRDVAVGLDAVVATAHTRDDHLETVLLRVLRGSGARGLAALSAPSPGVLRPLLTVTRADVEAYAAQRAVDWIEDPSNSSRAHLRNRVRHDVLPALLAVRPTLGGELLSLAQRAADWRHDVETFVATSVDARLHDGELVVARGSLARYDAKGLAVLWPALASSAGVTLDRRGTGRLSMFTIEGRNGGRIQLSGGWEVVLHADHIRVRRASERASNRSRALETGVEVGPYRFHVGATGADTGLWTGELPADRRLTARAWQAGDRMTPEGASGPRRVKRLLREAGIDALARREWPVVLADGEIVWVPGVRRGRAATVRPGGPVVRVQCERILDR